MEAGAAGAAGAKRELRTESNEAGRKKVAGPVAAAGAGGMTTKITSMLEASFKLIEHARLKSAVARLNKANPGAPPLVLEALTEQERAALVEEEKEFIRKVSAENSRRWLAQYEAALAQDPPEEEEEEEDPGKDEWDKRYACFRQHLEEKRANQSFSFEAITRIPAMCFTDKPIPGHNSYRPSVQIFTVKVAEINGGLCWPLDVFGMIAVRDKLDYSRNIIFSRTRDNPQTLTQQDPYFVLTGPTRAPLYRGYVYFEAVLKVKGTTESEDRDLSLLFQCYICCVAPNLCANEGDCSSKSCVASTLYSSKLSTLELQCGLVVSSVEATITLRIVEGSSWPDGFRGQFTACIGSVSRMKVLLLDSGEEKAPVVAADGTVELSRRVVSVESFGQLIIHGVIFRGGNQQGQVLADKKKSFAPLAAGRSRGLLDLDVCRLEVTIAWSRLLKYYPDDGLPLTNGSAGADSSS